MSNSFPTWKRALGLLLAFVMLMGVFPPGILARGEDPLPFGDITFAEQDIDNIDSDIFGLSFIANKLTIHEFVTTK